MISLGGVAEWAVRSALLIGTAALAVWVLRVRDASQRLAAWTLVLGASLTLPVISPLMPRLPILRTGVTASPRVLSTTKVVPSRTTAPLSSTPIGTVPTTPRPLPWRSLLTAIYFAVASALLLRLSTGWATGFRILRRCRTAGDTGACESERVHSPAVLGIVRPIVVLPIEWREWDPSTLDAVLAHERSHVRRFDPLVQFLSAVHRALLWFSPASWYLHRQLVRSAEDVSDDAAIAAVGDRANYAEILLGFLAQRAAEHGVAMARYGSAEQRIHRVLESSNLSGQVTAKQLALMVALCAPLAFVAAAAYPQTADPPNGPSDPEMKFDVLSVKLTPQPAPTTGGRKGGGGSGPEKTPGRIHYPHMRIKDVIMTAYGLEEFQIVGPEWLNAPDLSGRVDIDATMPAQTSTENFNVMLQNLLKDRLALAFHWETKDAPQYVLSITRGGFKLKESGPPPAEEKETAPTTIRRGVGPDGFPVMRARATEGRVAAFALNGRAELAGRRVTIHDLVETLHSSLWQLRVRDETGLNGKYDFTLKFALPDWGGQLRDFPELNVTAAEYEKMEPLPTLTQALQQIGLNLQMTKAPLRHLVIDRIDKAPSAN